MAIMVEREMKLSICATTHNAAAYVRRWHHSLLSLNPSEFVVVDDCSTDGTAEILRSLGCRVIVIPCDLGAGRNIAVNAAIEETILMTDVDNEYTQPHRALPTRSNEVRITMDARTRTVWTACGPRDEFLRCPSMKVPPEKWGDVREDYLFFARVKGSIVSVPFFGHDLKGAFLGRAHDSAAPWIRNRWFQNGMTTRDAVVLSLRFARGGDWGRAARIAAVLSMRFLTFGVP